MELTISIKDDFDIMFQRALQNLSTDQECVQYPLSSTLPKVQIKNYSNITSVTQNAPNETCRMFPLNIRAINMIKEKIKLPAW